MLRNVRVTDRHLLSICVGCWEKSESQIDIVDLRWYFAIVIAVVMTINFKWNADPHKNITDRSRRERKIDHKIFDSGKANERKNREQKHHGQVKA